MAGDRPVWVNAS